MTDAAPPVRYELRGDVGLIVIDSPPVNALGVAVRRGLLDALAEGEADRGASALVIAGAGRTFSAGADIREFGKTPEPPALPDLIDRVETSPKLTVAAIRGAALGGGLELALGCDYRVVEAGAKLALPEVRLGLLPGAGGTQRLPRLIGVEAALEIVAGGRPVHAAQAKALGLVDELADDDPVEAAFALARRLVAEGATKRPLSKLPASSPAPGWFDAKRAEVATTARGAEAPLACVDAIRAAVERPFAEGLAFERDLFVKLRGSAQSKALRHVFFAEREVAKVPGVPADAKPREVRSAAVIGAGTMGGGIAMCFANAGVPVRLLDAKPEALERGLAVVRRNYESSAKRGRMTEAQVAERMALITPASGYDALSDVDLVIEAVFEDMGVKTAIFAELERVCRPGAILATNTSTLDVNAIAASTSRPQDVVGMHFFSPANVMRLLEVVRGRETAPDALATAMSVGRALGKVSVAVGVCNGFVGNRMLHKRQAEAVLLVEEGASPEQTDKALTDFGLPMGPFAMTDLAGLDVGWRIREAQRKSGHLDAPPPNWLDALAERGRHGQKTCAGVYRYEEGSRKPLPDPETEALIAQTRAAKGVAPREIDEDEIRRRLLYVMINEGARILEEGIAARSLDIDVIWINGYGWPSFTGGPMFWADETGLRPIRDFCAETYARTGRAVWRPAPLLDRLAESGRQFDAASGG